LQSWLDGDVRRKGAFARVCAVASLIGEALSPAELLGQGFTARDPAPRAQTR
jgi:hypothetical protein